MQIDKKKIIRTLLQHFWKFLHTTYWKKNIYFPHISICKWILPTNYSRQYKANFSNCILIIHTHYMTVFIPYQVNQNVFRYEENNFSALLKQARIIILKQEALFFYQRNLTVFFYTSHRGFYWWNRHIAHVHFIAKNQLTQKLSLY